MNILDRMSSELSVPRSLLEKALELAHIRYRKVRIPKRSGGERVMLQPASELKLILSWIDLRILSIFPISPIATAFEPGTSIVKNARAHSNSHYSIRIDLTNFFPSIRSTDIVLAFSRSRKLLPEWAFENEVQHVLYKACFDRVGRLPIGYPTSPKIANILMYGVDEALVATITRDPIRFGQAALTRYADDIVFSTDKKGACREFLAEVRSVLIDTPSPKLSVNEAKTRFMSRGGGSTLITGLRINNDGDVGIHAKYRDHVRLLLKLFAAGRLDASENGSLRGHLAFIEHADPDLFTRLSYRYYGEIASLRGRSGLTAV